LSYRIVAPKARYEIAIRRRCPTGEVRYVEEPIIARDGANAARYVGNVISLLQERRGMQTGLRLRRRQRVIVK